MSETEKEPTIRVNDRRRFDPSGELRPEAPGSESVPDPQDPHSAVPAAGTGAEGAAAQPAGPDEVSQLRAELRAARNRINELARALQSLTQDREEFKQRLAREHERVLEVEKGKVWLTVVEAIDELDRCLSASEADTSPLAQGVRLIRDGLLSKLQSAGIERLSLLGKPFDPNFAEAADMEVTGTPAEDQKIIAEIRAGYRFKDRIIRPAQVKVAKYLRPARA